MVVKGDARYKEYIKILEKELVPAMGCTEPIAIAYCAAKARAVLGKMPDTVIIETSGNIIKNAKSVIVPNTNGMKGIEAAAAVGIVAGDDTLGLQVLSKSTKAQLEELHPFLQNAKIAVNIAQTENLLDISIKLINGDEYALVRIANEHTNIVLIEHNGNIVFQKSAEPQQNAIGVDYGMLNMQDIYHFALIADIQDVNSIIARQINYNTAISDEGLSKNYGANIGSVMLDTYGMDVRNRAKAKAAAGSDARMNGCGLPVIINSGSGNQGMTVSLPVIEFAQELGATEETLYRALLLSNLIAIYQKSKIGSLSAYCGAVSAGAAAGAGIAYLYGGDYNTISHTLINALAITSGIICDGAKASCAAKIAISVDAGILAHDMQQKGQDFYAGDGIVADGVENTIRNIGILGRAGMKETDKEILCMMTCFD